MGNPRLFTRIEPVIGFLYQRHALGVEARALVAPEGHAPVVVGGGVIASTHRDVDVRAFVLATAPNHLAEAGLFAKINDIGRIRRLGSETDAVDLEFGDLPDPTGVFGRLKK